MARNPGLFATVPAMFNRAKLLGIEVDAIDKLLEIDEDDLWRPAAYYIAQLCLTCSVLLTPRAIVLSSPLIKDEDSKLLIEIRRFFANLKRARRQDNYMIDYDEIRDGRTFISTPLPQRLAPEVAGCVYLAWLASRTGGEVISLTRRGPI